MLILDTRGELKLRWPIFLVAGLFIIQISAHIIDVSSVLALPIVALTLISEIALIFTGFWLITQQQYKQGGILLIFFLLSLVLSGVPFFYKGLAIQAARHISFSLNKEKYFKEISKTKPDADGLRFKEFLLGGSMLNPVVLVYDESDELSLSESIRSDKWKKKFSNSELQHCSYNAQKIKKHFYIIDYSC